MKLVMWVVWTITAVIWSFTLYKEVSEGHYFFLAAALLILALFAILYFAEGLEIAVADLRDKDPSVVSAEIRPALQEIQRDPEWFFSQRQIFVVAIISFAALLMEKGVTKFYFPFAEYLPFGRSPD